ncbi:maleylpyruvate isomerase family mycothiol-dependent enzyme [Streptomyces sp. 110]|uniref:Maleylpyruvate isomerase family mycothiol-dependent enzyme n=1 Tax=Streptomyces endocoffeicus TaxID=2898945 RepID=A0ABS1PVY9_9ACTN|nr:maleylpyruvate isomerase family mycothiol-dependent enzyme [Streptomyces endocoffeicus]MBL1116140.1 maleylpyruvate isomerase family mycothiol-dependent enzyme [Streptomyces endocoffeicus]
MPPRARARSYDPAKTRTAVVAQLRQVRKAAEGLDETALDAPTRLGDWTVRELIAHLAMAVTSVVRLLERPAPPAREVTVTGWASAVAGHAGPIDDDTRALAADADPGELLERAEARFAEVAAVAPADRLLAARVGAMRLDDYLVTRCVELVVHADDLADATGVPVPHDRQALATATRVLADALAVKAPGGSVEVRVPPFAVIQCVEGPRHTRGTPPNVVETDPPTWIRLATGRLTWAEALESGPLTASGDRADLSAHLPVLG